MKTLLQWVRNLLAREDSVRYDDKIAFCVNCTYRDGFNICRRLTLAFTKHSFKNDYDTCRAFSTRKMIITTTMAPPAPAIAMTRIAKPSGGGVVVVVVLVVVVVVGVVGEVTVTITVSDAVLPPTSITTIV